LPWPFSPFVAASPGGVGPAGGGACIAATPIVSPPIVTIRPSTNPRLMNQPPSLERQRAGAASGASPLHFIAMRAPAGILSTGPFISSLFAPGILRIERSPGADKQPHATGSRRTWQWHPNAVARAAAAAGPSAKPRRDVLWRGHGRARTLPKEPNILRKSASFTAGRLAHVSLIQKVTE